MSRPSAIFLTQSNRRPNKLIAGVAARATSSVHGVQTRRRVDEIAVVRHRQQRALDDLASVLLRLSIAGFANAVVDAERRRNFCLVINVWAIETRVPKIPVSSIRTKIASVWPKTSSVITRIANARIVPGMEAASALRVFSATRTDRPIFVAQSVAIIFVRHRKNHADFVVSMKSFSCQAFKQRKALQHVVVVQNRLAADWTQLVVVSGADADRKNKNAAEFEVLRNCDRISSVWKTVGDQNENFFAGFSLCGFENFLESNILYIFLWCFWLWEFEIPSLLIRHCRCLFHHRCKLCSGFGGWEACTCRFQSKRQIFGRCEQSWSSKSNWGSKCTLRSKLSFRLKSKYQIEFKFRFN